MNAADITVDSFVSSLGATVKAGERRGFDVHKTLQMPFKPHRLFVNVNRPKIAILRVVLVGGVNILEYPTVDAWLFSPINPQHASVALLWPAGYTRHIRAIGYMTKNAPEGFDVGAPFLLAIDFDGVVEVPAMPKENS